MLKIKRTSIQDKEGKNIVNIDTIDPSQYFYSSVNFLKTFVENNENKLINVFDLLKGRQKKVLVYILKNINKCNILKFKQTELSLEINLCTKTVYSAVKTLLENNVLKRLGSKSIYMLNPNIAYKGTATDREKSCNLYNDYQKNYKYKIIPVSNSHNPIFDERKNEIGFIMEDTVAIKNDVHFEKLFLDDLSIFENLNSSEFKVLKYIIKNKHTPDNIVILKRKQLVKILHICEVTFTSAMKKLKLFDVIRKCPFDNNLYVVNPVFIFKGTEYLRSKCYQDFVSCDQFFDMKKNILDTVKEVRSEEKQKPMSIEIKKTMPIEVKNERLNI